MVDLCSEPDASFLEFTDTLLLTLAHIFNLGFLLLELIALVLRGLKISPQVLYITLQLSNGLLILVVFTEQKVKLGLFLCDFIFEIFNHLSLVRR